MQDLHDGLQLYAPLADGFGRYARNIGLRKADLHVYCFMYEEAR
jgi:hypothetical protein